MVAEGNKWVSASHSHIGHLSDDLLIEILCKVGSFKQVTFCRFVCKPWLSLINTHSSHSTFIRHWRRTNRPLHDSGRDLIALHTQYQDQKNYHVIDFPSEEPKEIFFPRTNNTKIDPVHILASHKDLVLCCPSKSDHSVYYLCNPFSGQWRALPPPPPLPIDAREHRIRIGLLVFDGNDCCDDFKFKVVRVFPYMVSGQCDQMKVEMFSLGRRGWREMTVPEFECSYISRGVAYQGMLVWPVQSSLRHLQLIGFDFLPRDDADASHAGWSYLPLPPGYGPGCALGVCGGRLRIAHVVGRRLLTWKLGIQSKEWQLVQELDFSEAWYSDDSSISVVASCVKGDVSVLAFHPHDEGILYLFCALPIMMTEDKNMSSCIFSCNVNTRTLTLIRWLSVRSSCEAFPLLMPSWPTLFPPFH